MSDLAFWIVSVFAISVCLVVCVAIVKHCNEMIRKTELLKREMLEMLKNKRGGDDNNQS